MLLIPVIDLRNGHAVAARGGRRDEYLPLVSPWSPGSDPVALARALRRNRKFHELYLADLDAIERRGGHHDVVNAIAETGPLWLDPGLRDSSTLQPEQLPKSLRLVAGLETLAGVDALRSIVEQVGADRVLFSLDLKQGNPMIGTSSGWPAPDPIALVRSALAAGVRRVLLLDVGRVGGGSGLAGWAIPLLTKLRDAGLSAEWYAGGGLKGMNERNPLQEAGFSGILIGTALHQSDIMNTL